MHRTLRTLTTAVVCVATLVACGSNASTGDTSAVSGFPMTVENCGEQVTFEKPPERVLLIAKAGEFPPELYPVPTRAALGENSDDRQ